MKYIIFLFFIANILNVNAQNVGINTTNPKSSLDINGDLRLQSFILPLAAGYHHDVDINTNKYSIYSFSGDILYGGAIISGFIGGDDGRMVTLYNNSTAYAIQLLHESNALNQSQDTNRIISPTGQTIIISPSGSLNLRYDGNKNRWTVTSGSATDGIFYPTGWSLLGNSYTTSTSNYIGTNDDQALSFRTNQLERMKLHHDTLHLATNINMLAQKDIITSGSIKPNGQAGLANQVLTSNGSGGMAWSSINSGGSNSIGNNGSWGDCSMHNIDEYFPVASDDGGSNEQFGESVAISGNYALVGIPTDSEGYNANGSVTLFKRDSITGVWQTHGYLLNQNPADGDNFGSSVSLDADYAIVGAPYDSENGFVYNGSVAIFKRNNNFGNWELQGNKIINQNAQGSDGFGWSVDIDGPYAIVGAPYDSENGYQNIGSVSIYKRNSSSGQWELQGNKIINQNAQSYDYFGWDVAIKGDYAVVSSPGDDENGLTNNGSVIVLKRNSNSGNWEHLGTKLLNPNADSHEEFGLSVDIDNDYIMVGCPQDDENSLTDIGSVSFFKKNLSSGFFDSPGIKIMNDSETNYSGLGRSVSISGEFAIAGSPYDLNTGAAIIYKRTYNIWRPFQKVKDPASVIQGSFGKAVALDKINLRFLIGAPTTQNSQGMTFFGKIK